MDTLFFFFFNTDDDDDDLVARLFSSEYSSPPTCGTKDALLEGYAQGCKVSY